MSEPEPDQGPPDHGPGVRVPPPIMVAGAIAAAWAMMRVLPLPIGEPLPGIGALVLFAALALIGWAVFAMVRAGTDPRPDRPDAVLIESGPFRFSRNPIYLGFLLLATGMALRWGDLWGWIGVAACHLMLDRLVIAREETYLVARFGAAYDAYRARVRRWM